MIIDALRRVISSLAMTAPPHPRLQISTAKARDCTAQMGDEIELGDGVTLRSAARSSGMRLIKDGKVFKIWEGRDILTCLVNQPGCTGSNVTFTIGHGAGLDFQQSNLLR